MTDRQNSARSHIVMRFQCTDCGGFLNFSYDPQGAAKKSTPCDDGISGAFKVENTLYVEPCKGCVGKAREPLLAMKAALDSLSVKP